MDSNDLLFKYIAIAVILAWRDFRIQRRGQRKEELNLSGLYKTRMEKTAGTLQQRDESYSILA